MTTQRVLVALSWLVTEASVIGAAVLVLKALHVLSDLGVILL